MARRRTKLNLSRQQLAWLKKRVAIAGRREKQKLRVLILAAGGHHTLDQLARRAGCVRSTVQDWLRLFDQKGLRGGLERKRPAGRPSPLEKIRQQLKDGLAARRWTTEVDISSWLAREQGIRMAPKSVRFRLRQMGMPLRRRRFSYDRKAPGMRLKFPRKFAQKQRAYKSPESILSHDAGNAGARALIERFQGNPPSVEAIDVWLEGINDMLGSGEFSLEEANACLLRLQEAWEDFRRQ